jgi:Uma2 family endonuclease
MLGYLLGPPFHMGSGGPGGWLILVEPELHLHDDILVPDIAGWRRERVPGVTDDAFFTIAPDWVCETLSKSTEKLDRAQKLPIYAAAGVEHLWLVSPRVRTVEVYRRQGATWTLVGVYGTQKVRLPPFEAIELDLALLWGDLPPPMRASEGAAQYEYDE